MKSNICIPQRINVGFQNRNDTYTQKLAYVIYYDHKGVLRKQPSWEGWRDKTIDPIEYPNIPTEGFVLNKKAGGYSTGWNHRQTYCRVYDPRGFEFEITVANLLYILENTNCIKGKGLEGEFVYGWDGADLLLIPTSSPDYAALSEFNDKLSSNATVKAKDLIVGATYLGKDNKSYVFMGKYDSYEYQYRTGSVENPVWYKKYNEIPTEAVHTSGSGYAWGSRSRPISHVYALNHTGSKGYFFTLLENGGEQHLHKKSISGFLISVLDSNPVTNFAEMFDRFEHYPYYSPIDDSKDEIIPYTLPEFMESFDEWKRRYYYDAAGIKYELRVEHKPSGDLEAWEFLYRTTVGPENTHFAADGEKYTLQELFVIINPVHLDKYLANNKFYKREY